MIKWLRPSGTTIETSHFDGNIEVAKKLGWIRADEEVKIEAEVKPKRKRRTPAEMAAAREEGSNGECSAGLQSDTTEDSSTGC
jgi:hypothetical protein